MVGKYTVDIYKLKKEGGIKKFPERRRATWVEKPRMLRVSMIALLCPNCARGPWL